jgi:hypothetical protein
LLGDISRSLLAGNYSDARFVLYPIVLPSRSAGDEVAPWVRLLRIYRNMETHPEIGLILVAAIVFVGLRIRARFMSETT